MTFNEKLVKLRKLKGLTQDEFASAVGVSRQAVYKWESGQSYPEVPKLREMKLIFDISIDDLLDDNYEVIVPEKKRRRRISTESKKQIEQTVIAEETAPKVEEAPAVEEAPKAEPVMVEEVAPKVETAVVEEAPKAEPVKVEEPAPKAEEAPVVEEAAKAEPAKRGFFSKLFGRK